MNPLPTTDLIWPTLDSALYRISIARTDDDINDLIRTMRKTRQVSNVHRFDEDEQKRFWGTIRRKALSLGLYQLPSDGTWRKRVADREK